jgi:hypothetical protein
MDAWVRWRQSVCCVFSDPLFLVTNGQSNVCEDRDFLAFVSFLSQTNYLFDKYLFSCWSHPNIVTLMSIVSQQWLYSPTIQWTRFFLKNRECNLYPNWIGVTYLCFIFNNLRKTYPRPRYPYEMKHPCLTLCNISWVKASLANNIRNVIIKHTLKENFSLDFFLMKALSKSCSIWNYNGINKFLSCNVPSERIMKKFLNRFNKVLGTEKQPFFPFLSWPLISKSTPNSFLFDFFQR